MNEDKLTIGVDCDDVVISLVPTWLSLYNKDYNDNLTPEQITDWDVGLFVKPECDNKIFYCVYGLDQYWQFNDGTATIREVHRLLPETKEWLEISDHKNEGENLPLPDVPVEQPQEGV